MSRKKMFDSFIEKAVEGGVLVEGEESWKKFVNELGERKLEGLERERREGEGRGGFLEDLKKLLVIRVRKQFERVADDVEKGVFWIESLLDEISNEVKANEVVNEVKVKGGAKGDYVNDLIFFDKVWEEFGKVLEEESDIAYHLFVIYQEARKKAEKSNKGKDYVKRVMKQYAKDFFNKLYISMESIAKFCESVERIYDKIEEAKEKIQKRRIQNQGQDQGQGQGQGQDYGQDQKQGQRRGQGQILVLLKKQAKNTDNVVVFNLAKRLANLLDEGENCEINEKKKGSKKKSSKIVM